jgi:hypothetical protein
MLGVGGSMNTSHAYHFGVYMADAILDGTATYAARHVVVRAESPGKAIYEALALAKQTDSRACLGAVGGIIYAHGKDQGVVWLLDLLGPVEIKELGARNES